MNEPLTPTRRGDDDERVEMPHPRTGPRARRFVLPQAVAILDAAHPDTQPEPPAEFYHGHDSFYEGCAECNAATLDAAQPDTRRNPSAEPYYLPMDCPVCGRVRMEWDGKVLSCEKCFTSSEWDGFSRDRYAQPDTRLREALDYEGMRNQLSWPTPNNMRQTADALDALTAARYGDVLRWVADACDSAIKETDR